MLQAETDRDLVRRHLADKAREKELLGTETSPYNSDRYVGSSMSTTTDLDLGSYDHSLCLLQ